MTLLTVMALSGEAFAQKRGRGRANSTWGNKCAKFVNCHDARDGRWDNRGPRRRILYRRSNYRSQWERRNNNTWRRRDNRRFRVYHVGRRRG